MRIAIISVFGVISLTAAYFLYTLKPVAEGVSFQTLTIAKGDGFREIAGELESGGLIRSSTGFKIYGFLSGNAHKLKPGEYRLSPSWSAREILGKLVSGPVQDIELTITEGETLLDINNQLRLLGILKPKEKLNPKLEGYLFPDTYRFYASSSAAELEKRFSENFTKKALPAIAVGIKNFKANYPAPNKKTLPSEFGKQILIVASLIEKEVPRDADRVLVAGILWKRFDSDVPLQVDATICYAKLKTTEGCHPLKRSDFSINSPYNTYRNYGLPPGPIGNPGVKAIQAAANPKNSDYWYYLSDPKSKITIFSKTLDEHNENRAKYLGL